MMRETERRPAPGLLTALILFALLGGGVFALQLGARYHEPIHFIGGILAVIGSLVCFGGIFPLEPNDARVLTLFGRYVGTVKQPGLWWVNPFIKRQAISLRVRNFETAKL